jgi:6-pyruvoyltetrahydropterin/6-carboxytetrahydropterin synthase
MFRLTREVRFAINQTRDDQLSRRPTNSFAGYPSLTGLGHYSTLAATIAGELDPSSNYLLNIKQIDEQVRRRAIPLVDHAIRQQQFQGGGNLLRELFHVLHDAWHPAKLDALCLALTPFMNLTLDASEPSMVRLSHKFEFSASHRLHNPQLSDDENCRIFGKCNNPHGHGHNYVLQVTLRGTPDENGLLMEVPAFEQVVAEVVIDRVDHKNLNTELADFRELIPSVENIARVIHGWLKPRLRTARSELASVTVWETPKTWCEYSE